MKCEVINKEGNLRCPLISELVCGMLHIAKHLLALAMLCTTLDCLWPDCWKERQCRSSCYRAYAVKAEEMGEGEEINVRQGVAKRMVYL